MDRRYEHPPPPRDRYMYPRSRYEERPPLLRDDRYYRRDDPLPPPGRRYPYDRYPPAPSSSRRPYPGSPPYPLRPHYSQERRTGYKSQDSKHFSRKEFERSSHSSKSTEDQAQMSKDSVPVIASPTTNDKKDKIEYRDKKVEKEELTQQTELSSTPKEELVSLAVEQVGEVHMQIDSQTHQKEESIKIVRKEAVISFDSDGEDHIMEADWGNESDDEDFYGGRQSQQPVNDDVKRDQEEEEEEEEEKEQGEESDDESLPESWATHITDKGEKYYYNKITRESMWDKPTEENITKARQERKEDKDAKKQAENKKATSSVDKTENKTHNSKPADDNRSSSGRNVKDGNAKMDTINIESIKREGGIKSSNIGNNTGIKRKQSFDREESRLPKSLADRLKFPKTSADSSSNSEATYSPSINSSHKAEVDKEKTSTQPSTKRVYHLKNPAPHPASYEYRSRYNGPPPLPPPPDRYYHRSSMPPPSLHSNGRHVYIDYHHPPSPPPPHHRSLYRYHPMDYPPLPPPPPLRYYSSRRAEYDRRDAPLPLPPFSRSSRDYR